METSTTPARLLRLLLCLLPAFATWACIQMLRGWHPTAGSYSSTAITFLITLAATTLSIITLFKPNLHWANRTLPKAFYFAALTGFSIPITRALMPWEEPETGMGSPLVVLIGLGFYTVIGFVLISLPMISVAKSAKEANDWRS